MFATQPARQAVASPAKPTRSLGRSNDSFGLDALKDGAFNRRLNTALGGRDAKDRSADITRNTTNGDSTAVRAPDATKRVERPRRSERVDDTRPADNERTDTSNDTKRSKPKAGKPLNEAADDTSSDPANPDIETANKPTDSDSDALSPEAIVAAVMTMASAPIEPEAAAPDDVTVVESVQADANKDTSPMAIAATVVAAQQASVDTGNTTAVEGEADTKSAHAAAAAVHGQPAKTDTESTPADAAVTSAVKAVKAQSQNDQQPPQGDGRQGDAPRDQSQPEARPHAHHDGKPAAIDAATPVVEADVSQDTPQTNAVDVALDRLTSLIDPTQAANAQPNSPVDGRTTAAPLAPEQQFAKDNLDNLVTSVRTQAATTADGKVAGNQMHIRLDPPELGALEVAVKMVDGKMSASFTTSNDQATQLLSHNLNQLKSTLEASGVQVDRIQVRQSSESNSSSSSNSNGGDGRSSEGRTAQDDANAQQNNQQRKDAVERMWRRFAYGADDLDLVA